MTQTLVDGVMILVLLLQVLVTVDYTRESVLLNALGV